LFEYVQFSERIAHGVSSGIDTLITTTSKGYIFSRDGAKEELEIDLDAFLVIGNSYQKGSTKLAVDIVKKQAQTPNGKKHIDVLGKLALDFYTSLKNGDKQDLGNIMNNAQDSLRALKLETEVLKTMIIDARINGALGAKLTGAGLGGCVIALASDKETAETISKSWDSNGFKSWIMDMKEAV